MMPPTLLLESFQTWLEGKGDDFVGVTREACWCPLACYLKELTGERYSIHGYYYPKKYYHRTGHGRITPLWALQFMKLIDMKGNGKVYAHQALQVLRTVNV